MASRRLKATAGNAGSRLRRGRSRSGPMARCHSLAHSLSPSLPPSLRPDDTGLRPRPRNQLRSSHVPRHGTAWFGAEALMHVPAAPGARVAAPQLGRTRAGRSEWWGQSAAPPRWKYRDGRTGAPASRNLHIPPPRPPHRGQPQNLTHPRADSGAVRRCCARAPSRAWVVAPPLPLLPGLPQTWPRDRPAQRNRQSPSPSPPDD